MGVGEKAEKPKPKFNLFDLHYDPIHESEAEKKARVKTEAKKGITEGLGNLAKSEKELAKELDAIRFDPVLHN